MLIVSLLAFCTGPITFAVDLSVKWKMANFVFVAESTLFFLFSVTVSYLIFYKLCPAIFETIEFLQSQLNSVETPAMRRNVERMQLAYDTIHHSGVQNVLPYTVLGVTRLVLILIPHWFVFVTWLDAVRLSVVLY